jgi:hypothetical protein
MMKISFETDERPVLLTKLGLPEDASDDDIANGFTEWANDSSPVKAESQPNVPNGGGGHEGTPKEDPNREAPEEGNVPGPGSTPPSTSDQDADDVNASVVPDGEDVVVLDVAAYQSLTKRAQHAKKIEEEARQERRKNLIEGAIKDGKFSPGRREHYAARYDSDPEGTEALLARMSKNVVPLEERGASGDPEDIETDAYDPTWLPELQGRQDTENGNGERRKSRVTSEE